MAELLYTLVNSEWFWIFAVIWILIAIAWGAKRTALLTRLRILVGKPIIFEEDPEAEPEPGEPDPTPFYPRRLLEKIANGFRDTLRQPFQDLIAGFKEFIRRQHNMVFSEKNQLRTFAYIFFLICLLLFAYADAIAIANGLSTLGLLSTELPIWLLQYEIAVGVATFLSVIVGFIVWSQILSKRSDLMHWDEVEGAWRNAAQGIALIIIFIGIGVSILLGISRLIALGYIEANPTIEFFIQLGINVLILVNGLLSAAIVFAEAFRGIVLVWIAVEWILAGVAYILNWVATILGSVIPFLVDVIWRLIYIVLDIVLYLLFTPFLLLVKVLSFPFTWFKNPAGVETQTEETTG